MTLIPILKTYGINSICDNGENIIMLDYDINDIVKVTNEISKIMKKYDLSEFYIVKSTNGYNAFCLDKITIDTLKNIFNDCLLCDKNFKDMSIKKGYSTIRIGIDKKYVLTIASEQRITNYVKSRVHRNALIYYYDIPILNFNNYDLSTYCQLCKYENIKYGDAK